MWLRSVGVEQQGVLVHRRFNRCMGHHNTSRLQQRCSVAHKGRGRCACWWLGHVPGVLPLVAVSGTPQLQHAIASMMAGLVADTHTHTRCATWYGACVLPAGVGPKALRDLLPWHPIKPSCGSPTCVAPGSWGGRMLPPPHLPQPACGLVAPGGCQGGAHSTAPALVGIVWRPWYLGRQRGRALFEAAPVAACHVVV
jgi:hypothetical protein